MSTYDQRKILEELHLDIRHNMALWVQWFTFFVGMNYVAIGYFAVQAVPTQMLATKSADAIKPLYPHSLAYVAILLGSQSVLGIFFCSYLRAWFRKSAAELGATYRTLPHPVKPPAFSLHIYEKCLSLANWALVSLILLWALLAIRR